MGAFRGVLLRLAESDRQTRGDLLLYRGDERVWECRALELPWRENARNVSRIPPGRYQVSARSSEKYGDHFQVLDVFGRSLILIHPGNFYRQTRGCILVGRTFTDLDGDGYRDVTSSRATMRQLVGVAPSTWVLDVIEPTRAQA